MAFHNSNVEVKRVSQFQLQCLHCAKRRKIGIYKKDLKTDMFIRRLTPYENILDFYLSERCLTPSFSSDHTCLICGLASFG